MDLGELARLVNANPEGHEYSLKNLEGKSISIGQGLGKKEIEIRSVFYSPDGDGANCTFVEYTMIAPRNEQRIAGIASRLHATFAGEDNNMKALSAIVYMYLNREEPTRTGVVKLKDLRMPASKAIARCETMAVPKLVAPPKPVVPPKPAPPRAPAAQARR